MSSFSANGTASEPSLPAASSCARRAESPAVRKSWQVRPAPSSAWISPTKMPCMSARAAVLASARLGTNRFDFAVGPSLPSALRGSFMRSAMVTWLNRLSRANSSTGKNFLMLHLR